MAARSRWRPTLMAFSRQQRLVQFPLPWYPRGGERETRTHIYRHWRRARARIDFASGARWISTIARRYIHINAICAHTCGKKALVARVTISARTDIRMQKSCTHTHTHTGFMITRVTSAYRRFLNICARMYMCVRREHIRITILSSV